MNARPLLLAATLALSVYGTVSAQPESRCTRETLMVRGTAVLATYCVVSGGRAAPGHDLPVAVQETYAGPKGSFTQEATFRFIAGEEASRVIEDVPLGHLGLEGTLHVTLVLRAGLVHVEGAMLTPGAVTIK